MQQTVYDFSAQDINGHEVNFRDYSSKVLLIVNTASKCGFTKQYSGLEELYVKYKDRGLIILGFPCNQFLSQEPGDANEIKEFCSLNYGITFPLFSKVEVNGANTHPLYKYLKQECAGILGTGAIKWNFTKFLINKHGKAIKRYAPNVEPVELVEDIESLLKGG